MKIKAIYSLLLSLPFVAISCSEDSNLIKPVLSKVAVNVMADVNTKIEPLERDLSTQWLNNDSIGIFMVNSGSVLTEKNSISDFSNVKYVTNGSVSFHPVDNPIYYPIEGNVDFYAYSPYQQVKDNICQLDVSDQSDIHAIDFLYAEKVVGKNKLTPEVLFDFQHQLSLVEFQIDENTDIDDEKLAQLSIEAVDQPSLAQFNLATAELNIDNSSKTNIQFNSMDAGKSYQSLLLPTPRSSSLFFFKFNDKESDDLRWEMDSALIPGMKYIYHVELARTSIEVTLVKIQAWKNIEISDVVAE